MEKRLMASTEGKGGTGKSTLPVLLAIKLSKQGKRILLCDCDVECPNDYLLLNKEVRDPKQIYQEYPELDEEKCEKCGSCSKVCRQNAIFWVEEKYPVFFHDLCNGCGACWISCPHNAIEAKKEVVGESFTNRVNNNLWLLTGRSKPGIAETASIVGEVKKRALRFAEEVGAHHLLVDNSHGTHCNVIQALLGCKRAYIVTEPTPLGSYDAGLILELLENKVSNYSRGHRRKRSLHSPEEIPQE